MADFISRGIAKGNKDKIDAVQNVVGISLGSRQGNETDDTERFRRAATAANAVRGEVKIPLGEYVISDTIQVTDNKGYGCRFVGLNDEGVKIKTRLSGTKPLFAYKGGSGIFSNVGLKNITIVPDTGYEFGGTAIYINGQCYSKFENIHIAQLNYGIWIHNNYAGAFSELNKFEDIDIRNCKEHIRLEQGLGDPSFHGNDFDNVYLNVYADQIGFNHVSGYLYNARMNLFMWGYGTTATYIQANGNAEHLVGDITYESFGSPAVVTGTGRFWLSGFMRGIGGFTDNTADRVEGEEVFACTNYFKSRPYGTSGFNASALQEKSKKVNGSDGFFYRFSKSNVESVVLNTFDGSNENGLYLGRTGYQKNTTFGTLGMFLSSLGHTIKSFYANGLSIKTADDQTAMTFKDGRFTGSPAIRQTVAVPANTGVQQTFTLTGYNNSNTFFLVGLRVKGSNFENRRTLMANNQGFGAAGSATQLSSHYNLNATGVSIDSVTVDSSGNIVVAVTTDRALTIEYSAMGISNF